MSERQEMFSGTREVHERHRFDEARLARWMESNVPGFRGPLAVREFKGGQSNPTYRLEAPSGRYALRRKPPGELLPSAHAVDREYRVLTALGGTDVPVPRTHALCTDESVIGTWFYVMDCVEGRVIWDPTMPGFTPAERTAAWHSMTASLAALHRVDPAAVGLGDYGRPGNYFARQVARWSRQYAASETESIPAMDKLAEWLPQHLPPAGGHSIVHGDYKLDNAILHASEPRVVAILDWELSTTGDPLADFTYLLLPWWTQGGFEENPERAALGIPSKAELTDAYCRRTGRAALPRFEFYLVFHLFRAAAIQQGILGRVRDGTAASEHAASVASNVRGYAERAWEVASRG
jgi:aminoglycoside phosphotransferase (APT) family kinase protein